MQKGKKWEANYTVEDEQFGEGGNATVFLVKRIDNGKMYALKQLKEKSKEKKARFIEEIEIMEKHYKSIQGIMPILEYSKEEYWYIMPVAKSIIKHIKEKNMSLDQVIDIAIHFSDVLSDLHSKGISHRDIKPLNLYYLNENYYFGDFGLVDFPENEHDFTRSDKGLGAIFTIAPEMKRNPKAADGKKADVFSLAKTLWMLLTFDEKGFDGKYVREDETFGLHFYEKYKECHLVELENILEQATDNNPDKRPTSEEFAMLLEEYSEILKDDESSQESDWRFLSNRIFGKYEPKSTKWEDITQIVEVLNLVGNSPAFNHMLFSGMGGLDFKRAELASEKNCIYIYDTFGICQIVKPKCLFYEGFAEDYTWNYFMLEFGELPHIYECALSSGIGYEKLVEDRPGNYVSAKAEQYGVYDYDTGESLPEGYKVVNRYYSSGKLLFVLKKGLYNSIIAVYDGRHGMCTDEAFRSYIEKMIQVEHLANRKGVDPRAVLNSRFCENPFQKQEEDYDFEEMEKRIEAEKFVVSNFFKWRFQDEISDANNKNVASKYYFEFETSNDIFGSLEEKRWFLCKDGYFKKVKNDVTDIIVVYDRDEAIKIREDLKQVIREKLQLEGFEEENYKNYIEIIPEKNGKPNHIFTLEEVESEMRNADDRYNNMLVIDENGYAKVIRDIYNGHLYPIRNESWNAGNVYVGKYADLTECRELYMNLLVKWRDYLRYGKGTYIDYYDDICESEEKIVTDIKKLM